MSASSTNSSGSAASAIRSSIGSSPTGVISIRPPTANGPSSVIRSISAFHVGQPGTSAQRRQIASGAALVSMVCSVVHIASSFVYVLVLSVLVLPHRCAADPGLDDAGAVLERVAVTDDEVGGLARGKPAGPGRVQGGGGGDGGGPDGLAGGECLAGLQLQGLAVGAGELSVDRGSQVGQRVDRPAGVVGAERERDPGIEQEPAAGDGQVAAGAGRGEHAAVAGQEAGLVGDGHPGGGDLLGGGGVEQQQVVDGGQGQVDRD